MDLINTCNSVCEISKQVAAFIKKELSAIESKDIEVKGKNDFVTYVDKTSEKMILEQLHDLIPEAGFIAEENTLNHKGERYNWIVDPLDGTTNFIHGVPCFSISIALQENEKTILGVVYEINLNECFYASLGNGAFLNGKPIKVSSINKLENSLLATGFPYYDYSKLEPYMQVFNYCMKNTHGLRRLGSAAVDLAYVACGRFEGFFEYGLRPWDVAAGAFIVQEAGGNVSDFSGLDNYLFGKEIIASNHKVFDEFVNLVKQYLN